MSKLNLGCGKDVREGYVNIDSRGLPGAVQRDVGDRESMEVFTGAEHILAKDILEHFPQADTPGILQMWADLLKPGGTIEVQVPDIRHAVQVAPNDYWLVRLVYGGQDYAENYHRAGFTKATLVELLQECGLEVTDAEQTKNGNVIAKARKP
jgi:predicted SAM-dependent methyltransferase